MFEEEIDESCGCGVTSMEFNVGTEEGAAGLYRIRADPGGGREKKSEGKENEKV